MNDVLVFERYVKLFEIEWDTFLQSNQCYTFQFQRRFLDLYESETTDFSQLIRDDSGNLIAIIALAIAEDSKTIISHPKSSYGGFVYKKGVSLQVKEFIFQKFISEISKSFPSYRIEIRTPIRSVDQSHVAEDRWLMWRMGFTINQVALHSVIDLQQELKIDTKRVKRSQKNIDVLETKSPEQIKDFWELLVSTLSGRHRVLPVHNLQQILKLINEFEKEIRVFLAFDAEGIILGGLVFFNTIRGFHLQYMAISDLGRSVGAGDFLISHAIKIAVEEQAFFFSFGHSHENLGLNINYGLLSYKAKFGTDHIDAFGWEITLHNQNS